MASQSDRKYRCETPPEILQDAEEAVNCLLPEKSIQKYKKTYEQFMSWMSEKQIKSLSENVMLSYFYQKAKIFKPSTLWAIYSMLKSTLSAKNNINIKEYTRLSAFLRKQAKGYRSKKSRLFTVTDIYKFLQNAPDEVYLAHKVVLILGVNGACRCQDLIELSVDDIEIHGNVMLVKIHDSKTKKQRSFVISDSFYEIVKKYKNLRPEDVDTKRFLLQCRNNKCTRQVMGKNYICAIPKKIATYLNLPNPDEYTGHCIRKTSSKLVDNSGSVLTMIEQHFGEMSSTVTEGHKENAEDPEVFIVSRHEEEPESTSRQDSPISLLDDEAESSDEESQEINDIVYVCHACKCRISGVRYKCVQCSDYDVCAACEARGVHALHYALRVPEHSVQDEVLRVIEAIKNCLNDDSSTISEFKKEIKTMPEVNKETDNLLDLQVELEVTSEEDLIKEEFEAIEECDPLSSHEEQQVSRATERPTQHTPTSSQHPAPTQHTATIRHTACIQASAPYYPDIAAEKHEDLAATHHTDTAFANFAFAYNIVMNTISQGNTSLPLTREQTTKKLSQKPRKLQKNKDEQSKKLQKNTDEPSATAEVYLLDQRLSVCARLQPSNLKDSGLKRPLKIELNSTASPLAGLTNGNAGKRKKCFNSN